MEEKIIINGVKLFQTVRNKITAPSN